MFARGNGMRIVYKITFFSACLAYFSNLSGDAAQLERERVRRQDAQYHQELEQRRQDREDYYYQNLENQELKRQVDDRPLTIPPQERVWDSNPGF